MVSFNPQGEGTLDLLPTIDGFKPTHGIQMLGNFGANCQAMGIGTPIGKENPMVVGLFGGNTLKVARKEKSFPLKVQDKWSVLPGKISNPTIAITTNEVLVFSTKDGNGYSVDPSSGKATPKRIPAGTVWIGDAGNDLVGKASDGTLFWLDRAGFTKKSVLGKESKGSRPAAMPGLVVFGDKAWTPKGMIKLESDGLPTADVIRGVGPSGKFGRPVIYEWRRGTEAHTGNLVQLRRGIIAEDANLAEDDPESDSYNRCSSNDGLLDGWKKFGYRGLDLKAMGCKPGHADVICLISRFDGVKKENLDNGVKQITDFYAKLKNKNSDGTTGINFHAVLLDPIKGEDEKRPWWANRDKFLPNKWRGLVHWMQVTPGGGGQANELSDGGTCGEGALWAVFVHEFGHQLGLNHEGFSPGYASPIYTSLMNYTYSYRFEDSIDNIHYSDGSFKDLILKESDLDETLPFPYEKVKFLEKGPYHFPVKQNGATTLVDWNRNGVFGEKHVKSSITYAYSIGGGTRDDLGGARTKTAPWLFEHQGQAYALYGTNDLPVDLKVDPTLSADRPGRLILRRMTKPKAWESEITVESGGLIGDPVAVSYGGKILTVYQTLAGVVGRWLQPTKKGLEMSSPFLVNANKALVPTAAVYKNRAYIFLTNPTDGKISYNVVDKNTISNEAFAFDFPSSNPVGLCTDTKNGEAILALAQDQDKGRTNRWQFRRFTALPNGQLKQTSGPEWVEGEAGGSRGSGRLIALFDATRDAGPNGRVMIIGKGMTSASSPWSCCYVAHQIADKKFHGGWLVKRYYDEWTQSRSAPAATWFKGEILYAYRWVDGGQAASDNTLHVAYRGTGLQEATLSDFDDISFVRNYGLANSIPLLWNP